MTTYYKIQFEGRGGKTAPLVLCSADVPRKTTISEYSRLYPYSEANKMSIFRQSPDFPTREEAESFSFDDTVVRLLASVAKRKGWL